MSSRGARPPEPRLLPPALPCAVPGRTEPPPHCAASVSVCVCVCMYEYSIHVTITGTYIFLS